MHNVLNADRTSISLEWCSCEIAQKSKQMQFSKIAKDFNDFSDYESGFSLDIFRFPAEEEWDHLNFLICLPI